MKNIQIDDIIKSMDIVKSLKYGKIDKGSISDGYHSFDELYRHRMVLFACICNMQPDASWKSLYHSDGNMDEGYFIIGINTKDGQVTYHYKISEGWALFNVQELDRAPVWDGHNPEDGLYRLVKEFCASKF
ncbi:MAG: hypothetical protein ACRC0G_07845 [Fusobacteriaceae bacterium]